MISIFETEDIYKVVFEKVKKPEKPSLEEGLDKLEFENMFSGKEKMFDENKLWKLYAHYKNK